MKSNRIEHIDAIKAMGVVCIVFHHAGLGGVLQSFIYPFEVAGFMFVSGMLFNDKHTDTKHSLTEYIISKIKRLWIPLVFWNSLFVLLNNAFLFWGIYSDNPEVLLVNPGYSLDRYLTIQEQIIEIVRVATLQDTTHISGGSWFLRALVVLSILYAVVFFILNRLLEKTLHSKDGQDKVRACCKVVLIVSGCVLVLLITVLNNMYKLPYQITMIGDYYLLYSIGALMKTSIFERIKSTKPILEALLFIAAVSILLVNCLQAELMIHPILGTVIRVMAGMASVFICYCAFSLIKCVSLIKSVLMYLGKHSLSVIILHGFGFKLICYIQMLIYGYSNLYLAAGPVVNSPIWLIASVLMGISIPLLVDKIIRLLRNKTGFRLLYYVC